MELLSSCSTGEKSFWKVVTTAAHRHISRGHIPNIIFNLPDSTKRLIDERDSLRRLDPTNPHISTLDAQFHNSHKTSAPPKDRHGSTQSSRAHTNTTHHRSSNYSRYSPETVPPLPPTFTLSTSAHKPSVHSPASLITQQTSIVYQISGK